MSEIDGAGESHVARTPAHNRFDRLEWAGAFGELGTLIPFVVAYIGVLKMDPLGALFACGPPVPISGRYYKTPFPVQPRKAARSVTIPRPTQTSFITPAAVYAAG